MKKLLILLSALALTACGYSSRENEVVGQVKKVMLNTPILCPDFYDVDLSLGVMRNGTGSMSTQDMWIVFNKADLAVLKQANEDGGIVKITYDTQRVAICTNGKIASKVEVVK
jgi:major membrane immunogen (membrane-anchored lipoprotein)